MPLTALFVIDIQVDVAGDPDSRIPHADRIYEAGTTILKKARESIAAARQKGEEPPLTIVIVQHEETPEDGPMVKGSKPWELIFHPIEGDSAERVVAKTVRDTFESNPNLAQQLRSEGVSDIVAFGIQSECCVLSTCKGALSAGFKVTLLQGAHSTYDSSSRKAEQFERDVEEELKKKGAKVMPWTEYLA